MADFFGATAGAVDGWMVNRKQGWRAVGGTLSLLPDSLIFRPNAVDKMLAGAEWHVHLSQIRSIGKEPRNLGDSFAGGMRTRLRIDLADGGVELFAVWNLDEVIRRLSAYIAQVQQQGRQFAAPPAEPVAPAPRICTDCGASVAPGDRFCGRCGSSKG